jgi:glycosyltransferase involved in cell wall biosynthesis
MTERDPVPRISIGLPVFDGARYLAFAIDSILAQTCADFELVISDNGSTDATPEICRRYAAADPRVTYHRHEVNRGGAWNFNFVFHHTRAAYFKWACHDDVIAPTFLARCLEVLDANPDVVLCYPKTLIIDADGGNPVPYADGLHMASSSPVARFQQLVFREMRRCNPVLGLIRRSALSRTDLIGPYRSSDEILLAHLALLGKFYEVPAELTYRREHPCSSVRANPTPRQIYAWYDPQNHRRFLLPTLRHLFEYAGCIRRSGLGLRERSACLQLALRKFWWDRNLLWQDLQMSFRSRAEDDA